MRGTSLVAICIAANSLMTLDNQVNPNEMEIGQSPVSDPESPFLRFWAKQVPMTLSPGHAPSR